MAKKLLITGACGFIGSHLTEICVEKGYDVIAFDKYNSFNNWGYLENSKYKNNFEVVLGDLRDYDSVKKVIKKCDSVFHLGALIGIPYSYISPLAYIKTNIEGTYNILEASKESNVSNVIITSTSEVYGSALYTPMNEEHPLVGQSPYSASKIGADQISLSYNKSFGLPVKIARPFNTYGPRQSLRAIIPTIISQFENKNKYLRVGNLDTIRDFTYVTDTCEGILKINANKKFVGKVTNIGSGKGHSIKSIIKVIENLYKFKIPIKIDKNRIRPKDSEVNKLICDNSKLIKNTNWKNKVDINQGVKSYIEWYRNNALEIFKADKYNV